MSKKPTFIYRKGEPEPKVVAHSAEKIMVKYAAQIDQVDRICQDIVSGWSRQLNRRVRLLETRRSGNTVYLFMETSDKDSKSPPHYYKCEMTLQSNANPQSLGQNLADAAARFQTETSPAHPCEPPPP